VPELKGEPPFLLSRRRERELVSGGGIVGDARDDGCAIHQPSVFVPYTIMMPVWTNPCPNPGPALTVLHSIANRFTLLTLTSRLNEMSAISMAGSKRSRNGERDIW